MAPHLKQPAKSLATKLSGTELLEVLLGISRPPVETLRVLWGRTRNDRGCSHAVRQQSRACKRGGTAT